MELHHNGYTNCTSIMLAVTIHGSTFCILTTFFYTMILYLLCAYHVAVSIVFDGATGDRLLW